MYRQLRSILAGIFGRRYLIQVVHQDQPVMVPVQVAQKPRPKYAITADGLVVALNNGTKDASDHNAHWIDRCR